MGRERLHRLGVVVTAAAGFAIMASGVAVAVHDAQTIHGCAHQHHGALRVVDGADQCNPSESPLEWNEQGEAGPPGADGISGYEIVSHDEPNPEGNTSVTSTISCPSGKRVMGGGITALMIPMFSTEVVEGSTEAMLLSGSHPTGDGTAWSVRYEIRTYEHKAGDFVGVRLYAACASVS